MIIWLFVCLLARLQLGVAKLSVKRFQMRVYWSRSGPGRLDSAIFEIKMEVAVHHCLAVSANED